MAARDQRTDTRALSSGLCHADELIGSRIRQSAHQQNDPTLDTPILLVHGYGTSTVHWIAVERGLRDAGFGTVRAMAHNPLAGDIPALAARLVGMTRSMLAETGGTRVHLLGHSLGGLIVRYAVCVLGLDSDVDVAVTIATPHHGCRLARLAVGSVAAQCRPGSAVLRRMDNATQPGQTRWIAYYSSHDTFVPPSSAMIDAVGLHADNVRLDNADHFSILFSDRLVQAITTRLVLATTDSHHSLTTDRLGGARRPG